MKKLSIYLFFLIAGFLFGTCDIIEGPYLEEPDIINPGDDEIPRNVLILEYTGHTCKSCPKAHRTVDQLKELYGERIIPVAFHTGYFARAFSGDKFTMDFRTEQGAEMENYFEFAVFPIGMVGNLDKSRQSSYSSWPSEASAIIEQESPVKLMTSSEYDLSSGEIEVTVGLINKAALEGDVRLAVYLVEDGIISWQKDEDKDPIDVEDYVHKHVFRTSAGSVWGDGLSESDCSANANVQVKKYMLMDPAWVPENCAVVTYLYKTASREVIQCASEILIK